MQAQALTAAHLAQYRAYLLKEEKSGGTVGKYLRDVGRFTRWLEGRPASREETAAWREALLQKGYAPATINGMLASVNGLYRFLSWDGCRVKFLKIQRRIFREARRKLTRGEYRALLSAAERAGKERLALLMETICATGIRVSEVKYITVEAARAGRTEVRLKGKIRTILLPGKLCRKLKKYAKRQKIAAGEIFRTRTGASLSRRQIWGELKGLCRRAGGPESKVFPHNLRHLFATAFYAACKDIVRLADVLGHSSIETTRIYLTTSGAEHVRFLNQLKLIQ